MASILFGYVKKSVRSASVRFAEEPDTLFKYPQLPQFACRLSKFDLFLRCIISRNFLFSGTRFLFIAACMMEYKTRHSPGGLGMEAGLNQILYNYNYSYPR